VLRSMRSLADAPRTKIQQLREACASGAYYMGIVDARNALLRWPQGGGAGAVEDALAAIGAARGLDVDAFPWLKGKAAGTYCTPFVDLSDLFDFVAPETGPPAAPEDDDTEAGVEGEPEGDVDGPATAH